MPITRKFVAQDQEECQILKMDNIDTFIVNDCEEWQFLFGPNSALTTSTLKLKVACQFNTENFDGIKVIAYLYEDQTGFFASSGTCVFNVYKVTAPDWQDEYITAFNGSLLPNSYMYKQINSSDLSNISLDGETTLMIEGVATRLGVTYRDRVYINHLGVYDSIVRLRSDVDFLDITKKDL